MGQKHMRRIRHAPRPDVSGPVHVTVRLLAGLPNMRTPRAYRRLERAFRKGKEKSAFRLVHYAVLSNHMHLFVDVDDKRSLSKGMQALKVRLARALNITGTPNFIIGNEMVSGADTGRVEALIEAALADS